MKIEDFSKKNDDIVLAIRNNKVPLLYFPKLDELGIVEHSFTTREGGTSEGIFSTLNLSFTRGDDKQAVQENYSRLAEAMGTRKELFVCTDQTHTTNVIRVDSNYCGIGVTREKTYTDIDGLVTNIPGVVLATFFADCVPLYFVDPVKKAIGMSHSGWRGTVGRMGQKTLEKMKEEFGTRPKDVVAAIGPSICQDCYEISRDVAEVFINEFPDHVDEILLDKKNDKFQLDLWRTNEIILQEAGVLPENIAVTNICTCCNYKYLFSHRASQGKRGNLGAFMYIKETKDEK